MFCMRFLYFCFGLFLLFSLFVNFCVLALFLCICMYSCEFNKFSLIWEILFLLSCQINVFACKAIDSEKWCVLIFREWGGYKREVIIIFY